MSKAESYKYSFKVNPHPGFFVAIEGLDGSGNSTQAKRIAKELSKEGIRILLTKEPTSGPVGAMIRMALENRLKVDFETLQMMFTVDRADHLRGKRGIAERLKGREVVISDRYLASTLAFGYASGLDVDWLSVLQSKFFLPDKTYFLDVDPEVCIKRIRKSRPGLDLFEKEERLKKVKEGYGMVVKRLKNTGTIKVFDGEDKIENITKKVLGDIKKSDKYEDVLSYSQQALIKNEEKSTE